MTIIEQIKAEIERLRLEAKENCPEQTINRNYTPTQWQAIGEYNAYEIVGLFLDTLESEKPMNQKGLEREIERCLWKLSDDPSNEELRMFARHFAKWGAEHLASIGKTSPKDLEEAAKKHSCYDEDCEGAWYEPIVRNAFIAGAKWQAEQLLKSSPLPEDTVLFNKGVEEGKRLMMEGAVEGEVLDLGMNYLELSLFDAEKIGVKEGDKVRIIIVKEDL